MKTSIAPLTFLLAALLMAHGVWAGPADDKAGSSTYYSELDTLRSRNALLTEQLKSVELQGKIDAARGGAPSGGGYSVSPRSQSSSAGIDRGARVRLVAGIEDAMIATIQLSDGGTIPARVGARVPGIGVITSIKTDEVLARRGKEIITIPFANEPLNNSAQYAGPGGFPQGSPSGSLVIPGKN